MNTVDRAEKFVDCAEQFMKSGLDPVVALSLTDSYFNSWPQKSVSQDSAKTDRVLTAEELDEFIGDSDIMLGITGGRIIDVAPVPEPNKETEFMCRTVSVPLDKQISYPICNHQEGLRQAVDRISEVIKREYADEKIAFVCRGSSGVAAATLLTYLVPNTRMVYIRKENEMGHTIGIVGDYPLSSEGEKIMIVDDFIQSGATVKAMMMKLQARGMDIEAFVMLWGSDKVGSASFFNATFSDTGFPNVYIYGKRLIEDPALV